MTLTRQGNMKLREWIDLLTEQDWSEEDRQWIVYEFVHKMNVFVLENLLNDGSAAGSSEKSTGMGRGSVGGRAHHCNPESVLDAARAASTNAAPKPSTATDAGEPQGLRQGDVSVAAPKRYFLWATECQEGLCIESDENSSGDWVRWEDIASLFSSK